MKPYPCFRATHAAIDMISNLDEVQNINQFVKLLA